MDLVSLKKSLSDANSPFLKETVDHLPTVFYAKDLEGKMLVVNEAFRKLFDVTDEDIIGKDNHELFPEDVASQFRENDLKVINEKVAIEVEEVAIDHLGHKRTYHSVKFPYFDDSGNVIATGGISLDITEKKELEKQAYQSARLASIGQLAAGVGHEINNPLMIIQGYTSQLYDLITELKVSEAHQTLDRIQYGVYRISKIVQGLRTFARMDVEVEEEIDLYALVHDTVSVLRDIYSREGIDLRFIFPGLGERCLVRGSSGKIQQVLMNLIGNARDAVEDNKDKIIEVELKKVDGKVNVIVRDNGTGVDPQIQDRIFDPFFTTKDVDQGTGIGLSIAGNIVKEHNGQLLLKKSNLGGAEFVVELPPCLKKRSSTTEVTSQADTEF